MVSKNLNFLWKLAHVSLDAKICGSNCFSINLDYAVYCLQALPLLHHPFFALSRPLHPPPPRPLPSCTLLDSLFTD